MTVIPFDRPHACSCFVAVSLLLTNAVSGWADSLDPTTPSPSIAERLTDRDEVVETATAYEVVMLRRMQIDSASNLLCIGGMCLVVKDFSESCVIMQSADTEHQFIIN